MKESSAIESVPGPVRMYDLLGNEKEAARRLGMADVIRKQAAAPMSPIEERKYAALRDDIRRKRPKEFEEAGKRVMEGIVVV